MMKKIYCVILLLTFTKVEASKLDSIFTKANNFYQIEQYDSSIIYYDSILTLGYESEDIYFNLGNCYYLKGNIPKSILNYEKSLILNPENLDTKSNLEITQKRISFLEELPQLFIYKWWNYFYDFLSLKIWSIIVLIFIWLSCYSIYLFYNKKKKTIFNAIIILVTMSVIFASALNSKINSSQKIYGILSENTVIHVRPDLNTSICEVGQGNKALIIKEKEEWVFVRFSSGLEGWLKMESLLII